MRTLLVLLFLLPNEDEGIPAGTHDEPGTPGAWEQEIVFPPIAKRDLFEVQRISIETPHLTIHVGDGERSVAELREIAEELLDHTRTKLAAKGYEITDAAQADVTLRIRYRGYRNTPGQNAANAAARIASVPLAILSRGLCVLPLPYPRSDHPPSALDADLVERDTSAVLWRGSTTRQRDQPAAMMTELVLSLPARGESLQMSAPVGGVDIVVLRDGRRILGTIVSRNSRQIVLQSLDGTLETIGVSSTVIVGTVPRR